MSEIIYATLIGLSGGMIVGVVMYRVWVYLTFGQIRHPSDRKERSVECTAGKVERPPTPRPRMLGLCTDRTCTYNNKYHECLFSEPSRDIHGDCASRIIKYSISRDSSIRPAKVSECRSWMARYVFSGGRATYRYDYPASRSIDSWVVVSSGFIVSPRYGSNQRHYILADGVKFLGGDRGHSTIHFMDDGSVIGDYAPLYSDLI